MKRRLNLLCLLVMLVLSYSVFSTLYDFGRGVSAGLLAVSDACYAVWSILTIQ